MAPLISASVQAPIPFSLPYDFYKVFTTSDLDAVVAYVRSVAPVSNKVQTPVYKAAMHGDIPPGAEKQMTAADLDTPVKRGFYVATIAHCMECHTPMVNDRHDFVNDLGKGGEEFRGPFGVSVSRNITSHVFAMDIQLSGGPQEWDRPTYKVRGANITPDRLSALIPVAPRFAECSTRSSPESRFLGT